MACCVCFCGPNKRIIVDCGITSLCTKVDLYSDAKEDMLSGALFAGFIFPFSPAGGTC